MTTNKTILILIAIVIILGGVYTYNTVKFNPKLPDQIQNQNTTTTQSSNLKVAEAKVIAQNSVCAQEGTLSDSVSPTYNQNSETWWFSLLPKTTRQGCDPACVVSSQTKTAEINWRCTGFNQPQSQQTSATRDLTLNQAKAIAQNSVCAQEGTLSDSPAPFFNDNSKTWWLGFSPSSPKSGCNPACIVWSDTKKVEINWRCTGAIQP